MSISTGKGDYGCTMFRGERTEKSADALRLQGALDELNVAAANIGYVKRPDFNRAIENNGFFAGEDSERVGRETVLVNSVTQDLISLTQDLALLTGAVHAGASPDGEKLAAHMTEQLLELDTALERLEDILPPLSHFIKPGGCLTSLACHNVRVVVRECERLFAAERMEDPKFIPFHPVFNRLSDVLFQLARAWNYVVGWLDDKWCPPEWLTARSKP